MAVSCPSCGATIGRSQATFCGFCGVDLRSRAEPAVGGTPTAPDIRQAEVATVASVLATAERPRRKARGVPRPERPHGRRRSRRRGGYLVLVLLLVAAGLGSGYVFLRGSSPEVGRVPAEWETGALPSADRQAFEDALASGSVTGSADVLDPALMDFSSERFLPPGSTVSIQTETFETAGKEFGRVEALVEGPEPGAWTLYLHKVGTRWLLFGTERIS